MRKKPELHIADKQALMVRVPAGQQCEICRRRPGPKRHFVTVPLPRGFSRICDEDMAEIKRLIRERAAPIVSVVLNEVLNAADAAAFAQVLQNAEGKNTPPGVAVLTQKPVLKRVFTTGIRRAFKGSQLRRT